MRKNKILTMLASGVGLATMVAPTTYLTSCNNNGETTKFDCVISADDSVFIEDFQQADGYVFWIFNLTVSTLYELPNDITCSFGVYTPAVPTMKIYVEYTGTSIATGEKSKTIQLKLIGIGGATIAETSASYLVHVWFRGGSEDKIYYEYSEDMSIQLMNRPKPPSN